MTAFEDPCMRPRYRGMSDPHDGNDQGGPLCIRWISYMGDYDDYFELNLIGPYETVDARNGDLRRLVALPGAYGKAEFVAASIDPRAGADHRNTPDEIARVTKFSEFCAAVMGGEFWEWEGDGEPPEPDPREPHPDQIALLP